MSHQWASSWSLVTLCLIAPASTIRQGLIPPHTRHKLRQWAILRGKHLHPVQLYFVELVEAAAGRQKSRFPLTRRYEGIGEGVVAFKSLGPFGGKEVAHGSPPEGEKSSECPPPNRADMKVPPPGTQGGAPHPIFPPRRFPVISPFGVWPLIHPFNIHHQGPNRYQKHFVYLWP